MNPGTRSGDEQTLYRWGIRRYGIVKRGNFIVHFNVIIPKTMSRKATEILREYQKEEDAHVKKGNKKWWKDAYEVWRTFA